MIVTKDQARWINQGRKTAHRLPATTDDCRYTPGRDYAIEVITDRPDNELYGFTSAIVGQPGKTRRRRKRIARTVARALITSVRRQHLRDMTVLDARAEGFRTTSEFQAAWCERHHLDEIDPDQAVWVLELDPVRESHDRVRYLHRRSEYGYTGDFRSALAGEDAEVVDEATQARFAREAFERDDLMRRERTAWIASLPAPQRLHVLSEEARARRVDVSHHERVIEDRLRRIQRALDGDGAAA